MWRVTYVREPRAESRGSFACFAAFAVDPAIAATEMCRMWGTRLP